MKKLIYPLFFIISNHVFAQEAHQNQNHHCHVIEIEGQFVTASCSEGLVGDYLFGLEGQSYPIVERFETTYKFVDSLGVIKAGDKLVSNQIIKPESIEIDAYGVKSQRSLLKSMKDEVVEGHYKLELYLSFLSIESLTFKTEGDEVLPKLSIDNAQLKTVPLNLMADFKFENVILSIEPDFSLGGGKLALYGNLKYFWLGAFIDYKREKTESIVEQNKEAIKSTVIGTEVYTGLSLRLYNETDNWATLTHFNVGYFKSKDEQGDNISGSESVEYEAAYAELGSMIHYKVNQKFFIGSSFNFMFGAGNYSTTILADKELDNMKLVGFRFTPLSIQARF